MAEDLTPDDQMIVVDDHSTDDSIVQIKKFQKTTQIDTKLIILPTNSGGPAYPRNLGIKIAKNDIICFFDNDDIWLKGRRDVLIDTFEKTKADAVFTGIYDNTENYPKRVKIHNSYKYISRLRIAFLNELKLSTSAIRKNVLTNINFCEDQKFSAVEDFSLWLTLSKEFIFVKCDSKTVWYRRHSQSISSNKWKQAIKVRQVYKKNFSTWQVYFMFYVLRGIINMIINKIKK